eukprot:6201067-Pleurochrysis_carterae.AAC.1
MATRAVVRRHEQRLRRREQRCVQVTEGKPRTKIRALERSGSLNESTTLRRGVCAASLLRLEEDELEEDVALALSKGLVALELVRQQRHQRKDGDEAADENGHPHHVEEDHHRDACATRRETV